MPNLCTAGSDWKLWAAFAAYSLLEFWLGRTERVKSSSTLEMAVRGVTMLILLIAYKLRRKDDGDGNQGN